MKNNILAFFFLLTFSAYGQIEIDRNDRFLLDQRNPSFGEIEKQKALINLGTGFYLNSNSITNDFTKGLLYTGFIDNERKDQVTKKLRDVNRGGYDFNGGITFEAGIKEDLSLIIGLNQRQQFNAAYSKDLFELVFRGNKQFAGQHAKLGPLSINFFDYQNLFVGLQKNTESGFNFGGGISLIRGGRFNTLRIDRGTLFTEQNGNYVDFDMKFKLAFSESENFFTSNGTGAAVNFNFSLVKERGRVNFEVRDLGIIQWKSLNTYEGDDVYRYDGIHINNILDFDESVFTRIQADSIAEDFGISREQKNFTYFVPATVHLNYARYLTEKITLVAGAKYMFNAGYVPRIYLKGIYYFGKSFFIAPTLAYGGFGKTDLELAAAKSFKDRFVISANLFYAEYLLLPKSTAGQGFNVSLTKLF